LYALAFGAAASALYNVIYGFTAYSTAASTAALCARLTVALEACWHATSDRVQRVTVVLFSTGVVMLAFNGSSEWHYLPTRHITTTGAAAMCFLFGILPASELHVRHLRLTGSWLAAQAVMSWTLPIYNVSWERRIAARWLYTLFVAALMAGWHATFRPARRGSACRPPLPPE
jgi:hypothetical protein